MDLEEGTTLAAVHARVSTAARQTHLAQDGPAEPRAIEQTNHCRRRRHHAA